jgi:hypothetical protein
MRTSARVASLAGVAGLGVAAAVAVGAAGDDGVRACALNSSGTIRATDARGKCGPGEFAITISGDAFKKGSGKTLTINGIPFKKGSGKTITINGTAFKKGSGKTITINGTAFGPGTAAGATGPAGPAGPSGVAGAAGSPGLAAGPPPIEVAGPVSASANAGSVSLAAAQFSHGDGVAHRLLLTGGFNAVCNPCGSTSAARTQFTIQRNGAGSPAVARRLPDLSTTSTGASGVFSEIVVTPSVCGPCTYTLAMSVLDSDVASSAKIDATGVRLGFVDLGPVAGG